MCVYNNNKWKHENASWKKNNNVKIVIVIVGFYSWIFLLTRYSSSLMKIKTIYIVSEAKQQ